MRSAAQASELLDQPAQPSTAVKLALFLLAKIAEDQGLRPSQRLLARMYFRKLRQAQEAADAREEERSERKQEGAQKRVRA